MFENGSLLRRRKRFKLHKPDKDLLKTELQALASAMPPPRADLGAPGSLGPEHAVSLPPTSSGGGGGGGGGLSPANLLRLREDVMRWEMQERRMMLAAAAAASQAFPGAGPDCTAATAAAQPPTSVGSALSCPSYYLLSPEARQRLVEGQAAGDSFETAALLQSAASWGFSAAGFGSAGGNYLGGAAAYPTDVRLHESEAAVAALNFREASSYYARERLSAERLEDESTGTATGLGYPSSLVLEAPPTSSAQLTGQQHVGSSRPIGKKAKKPFTIENIIAPDDHQEELSIGKRIEPEEKKIVLSMPRPIYAAGFAMQPSLGDSAHQRPSYGAAT